MSIELQGSLFVDDAALACALALEFAGHALTAREGQLLVSQASTLTATERAAIRQHQRQLLTIAAYRAPTS